MHEAQRVAAENVAHVMAGHSVRENRLSRGRNDQSGSAIRDLTMGTLRSLGTQRALVRLMVSRGVPDPSLEALLCVALYQLQHSKAPAHAVVDHAVRAARGLGKGRASGFVNATLRRFLRERPLLVEHAARTDEGRWSHPGWWVSKLRQQYGDSQAEAILSAGLQRPPMGLRVNHRRQSTEAYLARLGSLGIRARYVGGAAILLEEPVPSATLPGFSEGDVSVQDVGAQWAAPLLDLRDGQRVLDACSAPGGKCAHMLETARVDLTAIDEDNARLASVEANLKRLGLTAGLIAADAADTATWWDGNAFDRILLDAPCSGSGIVRRHPDARWLRRPDDLIRFAAQQTRLLDALWHLLRPGGKLLYVTCSVFDEENAGVVLSFQANHPDAIRLDLGGDFPGNTHGQLLPDRNHDGFFYALLCKTPAS
ncbi:MAG: 16S rRNA (cytosine(967)-C(5))-methyltransferase RsmB [Betaproteobacteria bacterium]|nr:16S rRNA (cytosine(967)-C(5))-methyltransferase RsmB [Betaproteobacteria bacterium]